MHSTASEPIDSDLRKSHLDTKEADLSLSVAIVV